MPELKTKSFAESLLRNTARGAVQEESEKVSTSERQQTAQAFGLRVKFKDGIRVTDDDNHDDGMTDERVAA